MILFSKICINVFTAASDIWKLFGALKTEIVFKIAIALKNIKLYDDDDELEPVREPEAVDDLAPVREPEADDDLIILEEVNSGESGVMVAVPTQTEVKKTKKRKQPVITDFLLKKVVVDLVFLFFGLTFERF